MKKSFLPIPWFMRSPFISRTGKIFRVLAKHGLLILFTTLKSRPHSGKASLQFPDKKYADIGKRLKNALTELGVTFIKLGQAVSARSDLFPPEIINELSSLQDAVKPAPFNEIKTIIEAELDSSLDALFMNFDEEPIASASIGQVYKATLHTGQQVVVKVVRPGVEKEVLVDMDILSDIVDWAAEHTTLGATYDLRLLFDEFSYTLRNELDYQREGHNADRFRKDFLNDDHVYIPRIYWQYTTSKVITIERVSGIKINDLEALQKAGIAGETVAENLMHFAIRQIFEFGFYHADPHPGNFFVQPDGRLAVMDFGMVGKMSDSLKASLVHTAIALNQNDPALVVDELLSAEIYTNSSKRTALIREVDRLIEIFSQGELHELTANALNKAIMTMAFQYNLQLPSELVALIRAIAISEGIGKMLHPRLRMFEFAMPYIRSTWLQQQSLEVIAQRLQQTTRDSLEFGLKFPRRASRLLGQLERGQIEFNINGQILKDFASQLQQMTNRLAVAMILSGVIVVLGLLMVVYRPEEWQVLGNWLFGFAFISSLIFGAILLWNIWRSR